jgi:hypothetical protein
LPRISNRQKQSIVRVVVVVVVVSKDRGRGVVDNNQGSFLSLSNNSFVIDGDNRDATKLSISSLLTM